VLIETVGGKTRMSDEARERAAKVNPHASAYAFAERIFQVHWAPSDDAPTRGPSESARIIADACTIENPPLRLPPEAHAWWDAYNRLSDEDFLRLAALDPSPEIYEGAHSFWQANKSVTGPEWVA
jgi:hypothetical protein